jgi:hypothetical protein
MAGDRMQRSMQPYARHMQGSRITLAWGSAYSHMGCRSVCKACKCRGYPTRVREEDKYIFPYK